MIHWRPRVHWAQIYARPLERPNAEIKRRMNIVGIFPNERVDHGLVRASDRFAAADLEQ